MKKILLTAATATILASSSAYALENMFYVKTNGGWSKLSEVKVEKEKFKSGNSAFLGLGVGYYAMDNVRVDVTFDHFLNVEHKGSQSKDGTHATGKFKGDINTLMFGGFVDVMDLSVAKLFVGASAGMSRHVGGKFEYTETYTDTDTNTKVKHSATLKAKQKYNLAYAAHVGASAELVPGITGELSYSYRDMGKTNKFEGTEEGKTVSFDAAHYRGHHLGFGVRFDM
jgi:opacity protein-like surface antigen